MKFSNWKMWVVGIFATLLSLLAIGQTTIPTGYNGIYNDPILAVNGVKVGNECFRSVAMEYTGNNLFSVRSISATDTDLATCPSNWYDSATNTVNLNNVNVGGVGYNGVFEFKGAVNGAATLLLTSATPTPITPATKCAYGTLEKVGPVDNVCIIPMNKYSGSAGIPGIVAVTPQFKKTVHEDVKCGNIGSDCWNQAVANGEVNFHRTGQKDMNGQDILHATFWTMFNYDNTVPKPVWIGVGLTQATGLPPSPTNPRGDPNMNWGFTWGEIDRFVGLPNGRESRQNGTCVLSIVNPIDWSWTKKTFPCSNL